MNNTDSLYCPFQSLNTQVQDTLKENIKADFPDIPADVVESMVNQDYFPIQSCDPIIQAGWEQETIAERQSSAPSSSFTVHIPDPTQTASVVVEPVQAVPAIVIPDQMTPVAVEPVQAVPAIVIPDQMALVAVEPVQVASTESESKQAVKAELKFLALNCHMQPPNFSATPEDISNEYGLMQKATSTLCFVRVDGMVYCYNGKCYEVLDDVTALGKILGACRGEIQKVGRFVPLKNAYEFLKVDPTFQPPDDWVLYGRNYITFLNGNLNWKTGAFVPHSPNIFTTYVVQANYSDTVNLNQSSRFMNFLHQAGGGSAEWVKRAMEIIGYCLAPDISGKCAFLFQGRPNSGKSLLCNFISSLLPDNKVAALDVHDLGREFAAAELDGAAICIAPDMPAAPLKEEAVGRIKALSGNDLIQANRKYQRYKKFRFIGKFIMCSNHPLCTKVPDPAFDGRIVTLPFRFSTPPNEQDPDLLSKFQPERDYIVSCAINAFFSLRSNCYRFSGDFTMNAPDSLGCDSELPLEKVTTFAIKNLTPDPSGLIYVTDAYQLFLEQFGVDTDLPTFGRYLSDAVLALWGLSASRKRRSATQNPTSCYQGLTFKFEKGDSDHAL